MKKKGFTLIELLAVIVILAIIALIATPLVLKYIEKSRKEAKVDSAYSFVRNLETEIANFSIKNNGKKYNGQPSDKGYYEISNFENPKIDIKVKGDKPDSIKVCLSSLGQVEKAMFEYGKYYVSYDGKKGSISDEDTYDSFSCVDSGSNNDNDMVYRDVFPEQNLELKSGMVEGWGCAISELPADDIGLVVHNGIYRLTFGNNFPMNIKLTGDRYLLASGNIDVINGGEDKIADSDNYIFAISENVIQACLRDTLGYQKVKLEYINNIPIFSEGLYDFNTETVWSAIVDDKVERKYEYKYTDMISNKKWVIDENTVLDIKFNGKEYKDVTPSLFRDKLYYFGNIASYVSGFDNTEFDTDEDFFLVDGDLFETYESKLIADELLNNSADGTKATHEVAIYQHFPN